MSNSPRDTDASEAGTHDDAVGTTGHEWDGIRELNNPLPRWWLWIFYACCIWAVGYWLLMPAWPGINGYTRGLLGHSQRADVVEAVDGLRAMRADNVARLMVADLAAIEADPELLQFARAAGASAFGDNCATCHGSGAQGFPGYPNLNDDVWLWGGTLEDIQHTLTVGIRSVHPDTRLSMMPAFGRDGLLDRAQITDMTEYVVHLSGGEADAEAVARAAPVYAEQCGICHGDTGKGDREQGAPDLTDGNWLYGGSRAAIRAQIWDGRGGIMPFWESRLDAPTIKALAVYVHSLGGGE